MKSDIQFKVHPITGDVEIIQTTSFTAEEFAPIRNDILSYANSITSKEVIAGANKQNQIVSDEAAGT